MIYWGRSSAHCTVQKPTDHLLLYQPFFGRSGGLGGVSEYKKEVGGINIATFISVPIMVQKNLHVACERT